jgi:hypothetical protein
MNQRIQELAEEARANVPAGLVVNEWIDTYNRVFAQLIVQECMACSTWVGKVNTNLVEPLHTAHAINQRIKKQFGVEEN